MKTNTLPEGIPTAPLLDYQEESLTRSLTEKNREELVMHSLCEAIPYLHTVSRGQVEQDELLSISYAALVKAVKNYKPGGLRFFAYAKVYLRGELSRYWRDQDPVKNASLHEDKETESRPEPPALQDAPYSEIDLREQWALLKPLLRSRLTDRERMVIELFPAAL